MSPKTFKMAIQHNRRTTRTQLQTVFTICTFNNILLALSREAIAPHHPSPMIDPPLTRGGKRSQISTITVRNTDTSETKISFDNSSDVFHLASHLVYHQDQNAMRQRQRSGLRKSVNIGDGSRAVTIRCVIFSLGGRFIVYL